MDWIQVLVIIATLLGAVGYMHKEFKEWKREIREDMQAQSQRTDKLYEMYVETQQEIKNIYKERMS